MDLRCIRTCHRNIYRLYNTHETATSPTLPFPWCWFTMPELPPLFVPDVRHLHFKLTFVKRSYYKNKKKLNHTDQVTVPQLAKVLAC